MTISSSLNAGVAGLNANATRLATIADNIANSGTYGYKRATTDFHSLVMQGGGASRYTAGGVRSTSMRLIDERGPLVATTNSTDLSIDGRGFLPVTNIESVNNASGQLPLALATTGSFRPDTSGILRTDTGHVLMGWAALPDGTIPSYARDSATGLEPVRLSTNQFANNPTTLMGMAVNLPATATAAGAPGTPLDMSAEYFGNLGTSETLSMTFAPVIPATGQSNEWTMTITDSVSGSVVGEYTMTFNDSQSQGGTLASITTISGGAYDPLTGTIPLALGGGPVSLNIGLPGQVDGMTQLSSTFSPGTVSKNGSPVGNLAGVEVDSQGYLHAVYDQGFTRRLYQIPLIDVANPNGLISMNNESYAVSPASGGLYLWDAGDGPTGAMVGYAREESSTDVARELTQLIQTQRAYSSNAKIIQTVDEMLQETTNIKR